MLPYRLFVADVDGTLIGPDLAPSQRVRRAIRQARAAGIEVALCTGRTPLSCPDLLTQLGFDQPQIYLDGALISPPGSGMPIFCQAVDPAALRRLTALARAAGISLELYSRDGYFVEAPTPLIRLHEEIQGIPAVVVDFDELLETVTIVKAECLATGDAGRSAVRALETELAGHLRFSWAKVAGHPDVEFVNVVPPDISKGTALRHLAGWHRAPLERVVAVGDGHNDIPMIQAAGLGIAMGQAADAVRQAADLVTLSVEEDGLAVAIERILAGDWPPAGSSFGPGLGAARANR